MFVLERADTMNDEAANALLKTLEEPPAYVVLLLLTDRPDPGAADDRLALPARALRRAAAGRARRAAARRRGAAPAQARGRRAAVASATASARSRSRSATAPRCAPTPRRSRARRCTAASGAERPWLALLEAAAARGAAARAAHEAQLAEELQFLPKKEHKRRETEIGEQARRAERRAQTAALDHGLQLAGLWYRDLACVAAGAPELAHHADRADELAQDAEGRSLATLRAAAELVDDARARLALNVSYDLACEALAFRLERLPGLDRGPRSGQPLGRGLLPGRIAMKLGHHRPARR